MKFIQKQHIVLFFGAISFLLFATHFQLLDLIAPAKSIGQVIGENARDLIKSLSTEEELSTSSASKRRIWSNILTILSFLLAGVTYFLAAYSTTSPTNLWHRIGGAALASLGIIIYFVYLSISLYVMIVIVISVLALVTFFSG